MASIPRSTIRLPHNKVNISRKQADIPHSTVKGCIVKAGINTGPACIYGIKVNKYPEKQR